MPLPKIEHPLSFIEVPSTKKSIRFRPFLYKEEKILLGAQQSQNYKDIVEAMKQIVNNCDVESKLDVESMATFDLMYLYLKLYAISVKNIINLEYYDNEERAALEYVKTLTDGANTVIEEVTKKVNSQYDANLKSYKDINVKPYKFPVDLNTIEVQFPTEAFNKIKISDKGGIILSYPKVSITDSVLNADSPDILSEIIKACITTYYDNDGMYEFALASEAEKNEFIDSLSIPVLEQIKDFFINAPKIEHVITYKNSLGHERHIVLSKLEDFFS
jgi:hypothetical protein